MGPFSFDDARATALAEEWFQASRELLAEVYYPHSGKSGAYYLLSSTAQWKALGTSANPGAILFLLRRAPYPVRGVVDDDLIARALAVLPEGEWYEIMDLHPPPAALEMLASGHSHKELTVDLERHRGRVVAVGRPPSFPDRYWETNEDPDSLILFKSLLGRPADGIR